MVVRSPYGGGVMGEVSIDPTYSVAVNEVEVFVGEPRECERIQQWIDDARTMRCVALYGRLLPFQAVAGTDGAAGARVDGSARTPTAEGSATAR